MSDNVYPVGSGVLGIESARMKVKCISRAAKDLPNGIPEAVWGNVADARNRFFPLVVGKEYVVYGITMRGIGDPWYYICDENFTYYPVWKPSALFEISDGALPSCWRASYHSFGVGREKMFLIAFPEWADDLYFYEKLTDREAKEVDIFNNYRKIFEPSEP